MKVIADGTDLLTTLLSLFARVSAPYNVRDPVNVRGWFGFQINRRVYSQPNRSAVLQPTIDGSVIIEQYRRDNVIK